MCLKIQGFNMDVGKAEDKEKGAPHPHLEMNTTTVIV